MLFNKKAQNKAKHMDTDSDKNLLIIIKNEQDEVYATSADYSGVEIDSDDQMLSCSFNQTNRPLDRGKNKKQFLNEGENVAKEGQPSSSRVQAVEPIVFNASHRNANSELPISSGAVQPAVSQREPTFHLRSRTTVINEAASERDDVYEDFGENVQSLSPEVYNAVEIKAKIANGEYKIVPKIGKSKVWEIFGEVEINGDINKKIVACKRCNAIYRFNSTSILVKHKCFKESVSGYKHKADVHRKTKSRVVEAVTQWTIKNCRPFTLVADEGFIKYTELILSIGEKHGAEIEVEKLLPHPTTVSRNIDQLYGQSYDILQAELNTVNGNGFTFTTDLWTDHYAKTSYLAVTIHFIKNAKLHAKFIGFQSMHFESCTNEEILRKVTKILDNFNCSLDKGMIVTDRGSNMKAAFSGYNHIFCFNHLLHNIVEKAIKEISDIENLCKKCTKLVKYFRNSGCNAELTTTLKSFTPTRWNTIYYLLKSVHQNWTQIGKILQEKQQLFRISGININLMKQIMNLLRSFAETSTELEGDSYPTIHLAIIHVHFLKRLCGEENADDQDSVKTFKEKLNVLLSEEVMQNLTIFHKIAVFLFPPANKMLQFSSSEKEEIRSYCRYLMQNLPNDYAPIQNNPVGPLSAKTQRIFAGFFQSSIETNVCNRIHSELSAYDNVIEILYDGFDVLLWWELNKTKFPLLYQVSSKIFAAPASSASSERVLSSARNLLCEKRCLDSMSVEKIMFLHHNMKTKDIERDA